MQRHHTAIRRQPTRHLAASVLGLALAGPGLSWAEEPRVPGWYLGLGAGAATMQDEGEALAGSTSFDDEDTGWKLFGGWRFHRYGAVELAYVDFGEFTGEGPLRNNWEASGINASVLGVWPLPNRFSLFGKIGATYWDVENNFTGGSGDDNGTDFSYGVGAQYDFTDRVGARVEWERFQDVGEEGVTGTSDLDLISASVVFHF